MKNSYKILVLVALLGMFFSCQKIQDPKPVKVEAEGEVPFRLMVGIPGDGLATKSIVTGEETNVDTLQLVCFDASGLYLGIRTLHKLAAGETVNEYNEQVTWKEGISPTTPGALSDPTYGCVWAGQITGRVPLGTARIHFIANRNLETPLEFSAGASESVVMRSEVLSTGLDHGNIVYWGYHAEPTADDMTNWLTVHYVWNSTTQQYDSTGDPSIVHLIRDRARIMLDISDVSSQVQSITWLIHNGRDRGYIAPYDRTASNPFNRDATTGDGYTTVHTDASGAKRISTVGLNEYTASGRYTLYDSEATPAINRESEFTSSSTYQYVFDDINDKISETNDGRIKVVLKVTYNDNTHTAWGTNTKYLVILLKNDNGQIKIIRNNTYIIKVHDVSATGYQTLEEAINGDEFANAPVEVDRSILGISDASYLLRIALDGIETTSVVYNTKGVKYIGFEFLNAGDQTPVSDTEADDFEVKWEKNKYAWNPTNANFTSEALEYDSTKKKWYIKVDLQELGGDGSPIDDYLIIRHKSTDLTRYVHIYGVTEFKIVGEPEFEKMEGQFEGKDVYKLSFVLPDNYGEDLYPINVRFATSTLNAYSDATQNARHGTFGVDVTPTDVDGVTESSTKTAWNYKALSWDYWYVYSIPSYPGTLTQTTDDDGKVTIYFEDITSNKAETNPTSVGLFLDIPKFGSIRNFHTED